jgi:hypothetical protein
MTTREFFHVGGKTWLVRFRPVRRTEAATHVTLELVSDKETRIVSCRREEWEVTAPDYAGLLARSVAAGTSRGIGRPPDSPLGSD